MKEDYRPLIPLYFAAFLVLFCGVSAVNSTVEDPQLTFFSTFLVAAGVGLSLWMRVQNTDQRIIVWLASGMAAALFFIQPFFGEISQGFFSTTSRDGFSSSTIGVVLEWATVLFSFTLLTNYSLLFSVVPSMALIGLMSSENLNPEMVTYFIGFVLSTVFLMGYQAYLERTTEEGEASESPSPVSYRPFIILSAAVVAGAFVIGHVASAPLKYVGRQVFTVAASNLPSATAPLITLELKGTSDTMSLSGQTPNLTAAEVMRVKSRVAQYWRGATYEIYTGASWRTDFPLHDLDPMTDRDSGSDLNLFRLDRNDLLKGLKQREILNQTFSTIAFAETLYVAGEPRRIEGPMEQIRSSADLTLRSGWHANNLTYHATSLISNATPEQLRTAPSWDEIRNGSGAASAGPMYYPNFSLRSDDMLYEERMVDLLRLYTRRRSIPEQVRQEAERITRGRTTDYDRVLAIEQHLKQNYVYTLEPPLLPPGRDASAFFLFESRSGYCEQFANAMAVMLRSLRIPARIAVGYAPGEYDSASDEWVVRELDAHAWVEVFFPQYGWITFDPTGGVQPEQPGFSFRKIWNGIVRFINSREFLPTVVLLVILGALGYALKSEAYDRYLRPYIDESLRRWRNRNAPDPRWAVERNYRQLQKLLKKRGVPISSSQTPREIQDEVLRKFGDDSGLAQPVQQITRLYMEAAYSDRDLPPGSDQASEAWIQQVREGLKTHARR